MRDVSIAPRSRADARIADYLERQARRVRTTPPGTCPLVVLLSMVQAAAAQTCGKCVPCRDGLPRLAALLERLVACEADEKDLEDVQALADTVRATSDCAIGYEAATALLDGLEDFADEVKSHLQVRACAAGVGQTVPCETLCPAHVDVPAYIALVAEGRYAEAVNVVRRDNPFPTACSFVCEHPCEQRCRRTLLDAPVNIRGIKRFAVDGAPADQVPPPPRGADTGRTVAVVGGGPSGLSCAYFLGLMGHRVTVFEAREQLGGMMRYGIPAYRFPRERLDEDVRGILNAGGITARCGMAVGEREMRDVAGTYDAVYVAIGAQGGKTLALERADAEGVMSAVDLLGVIGDGDYPDFTGKRVVVVGGGNVAMDCARTAVRAGASEVTVAYRRRREDMTALPAEVESAVAEGVEIEPLKVGGSGTHSYDRHHPARMPERLEAGTLNAHGIAGLSAGLAYIEERGVEELGAQVRALAERFERGVRGIDGVRVLGGGGDAGRCGIVALNVGDADSAAIGDALNAEFGICTRAGAHCAPLMHEALGTQSQGAVRFSFSSFNTEDEVDAGIAAVAAIAEGA